MSNRFDSPQDAFMVLAGPSNPGWGRAFRFLSSYPETAELMLETFRETLEQVGVSPSGVDLETGAPAYGLADVASAMGIPEEGLDEAVRASDCSDAT